MADKGKDWVEKGYVHGRIPEKSPNTRGYVPPSIPAKPSSTSTPSGQGGGTGGGDTGSGKKS